MALRNPIIKIQSKGVDSKCLMDMLFCQETLKELSPFKTKKKRKKNSPRRKMKTTRPPRFTQLIYFFSHLRTVFSCCAITLLHTCNLNTRKEGVAGDEEMDQRLSAMAAFSEDRELRLAPTRWLTTVYNSRRPNTF